MKKRIIWVALICLILLTGCQGTINIGGNMTPIDDNLTTQQKIDALSPEDKTALDQIQRLMPIIQDKLIQAQKEQTANLTLPTTTLDGTEYDGKPLIPNPRANVKELSDNTDR